MSRTFYEVLDVPTTSTAQEIRRAFQRKSLEHHPDKKQPNLSALDVNASAEWLLVKEAFETLRDEDSRKTYDAALALSKNQLNHAIDDELDASELHSFRGDGEPSRLAHECRCGGSFCVLEAEFDSAIEVLVPCDTCSLFIKVTKT
mmetsp:Transcript_16868/g.43378  ORF Transcript_16868/g.43378 Transcript_16868/m.43378 type:complete len:146 (-) Transcript_16868:577-1014(-)